MMRSACSRPLRGETTWSMPPEKMRAPTRSFCRAAASASTAETSTPSSDLATGAPNSSDPERSTTSRSVSSRSSMKVFT